MNKLHLPIIVALLTIFSLGLFYYKAKVLGFPLEPSTKADVWHVEAAISFRAANKAAKATLFIPKSTSRMAVLDESFISKGFGLSTTTEEGNRSAEWSIRKTYGNQSLFYHAVIRYLEQTTTASVSKAPAVVEHGFEGAKLAAAQAIVDEIRAKSADTESFAGSLIRSVEDNEKDDRVALLIGKKKKSEIIKLDVIIRLLALEKIPARLVHGIRLEEVNRNSPILHWIEVFDKKSWIPFDPESGEAHIDDYLLPWWRGNAPVGDISGGSNFSVKLSVTRSEEEAIESAIRKGQVSEPLLMELSLFRLPIQTQAVYRIMLLVPLGGLLVVILRNVIGLETFGTFMPVLVALAFRETELLRGVILFSLVVAIGLGARFYLDKLKLLLIPRLASVLTLVVLILAGLSVLTYKIGFEHGLSIALFPMVILTMTIERMSIVWEEKGPVMAMKQGFGSLIAAVLATILMGVPELQHLLFVFPELLLIVLAITLLLGRYTGYRLTELWRFRELSRQ